jgi:hypothetical protein
LKKTEVQNIVNKIYPKIKKHYGLSDFYPEFPEVKLHHNIYARITGIDEMEGDCDPDADFERDSNTIWIYWPKASSPQWIAETILHEYTHYLQDATEMQRMYNEDGYEYNTHPFELEAIAKEKDWHLFID